MAGGSKKLSFSPGNKSWEIPVSHNVNWKPYGDRSGMDQHFYPMYT